MSSCWDRTSVIIQVRLFTSLLLHLKLSLRNVSLMTMTLVMYPLTSINVRTFQIAVLVDTGDDKTALM